MSAVMSRFKMILALVVFLALYHGVSLIWGAQAKVYFLIGTAILWALTSIALLVIARRQTGKIDLSPEDVKEFDFNDLVPGPTPKGIQKMFDGLLGLIFIVVPPIAVSLFRGDKLSMESELTGYHILAMFLGLGLYLILRPRFWTA